MDPQANFSVLQLGGSIKQKILNGERKEMDILVGSLGGLSKLFHERLNSGANVCEVALDEIDTLLDDTFKVVRAADLLTAFLIVMGQCREIFDSSCCLDCF